MGLLVASAAIGYEGPNLNRSCALASESKREQNRARNREATLNAARLVFVESGYMAATVRDIIGRTDLSPGRFYNDFPKKRDIADDIREVCRARIRAARAQAQRLDVAGATDFCARRCLLIDVYGFSLLQDVRAARL